MLSELTCVSPSSDPCQLLLIRTPTADSTLTVFLHTVLSKLACDSRPGLQLIEIYLFLPAKWCKVCTTIWLIQVFFSLLTSEIVCVCILCFLLFGFLFSMKLSARKSQEKVICKCNEIIVKQYTTCTYTLFGGGSLFFSVLPVICFLMCRGYMDTHCVELW